MLSFSLSHILEDLNIYHTSQTTQLAKLAQLYTSQQAGDQRANNEEGVKTVEALRQLHTTGRRELNIIFWIKNWYR